MRAGIAAKRDAAAAILKPRIEFGFADYWASEISKPAPGVAAKAAGAEEPPAATVAADGGVGRRGRGGIDVGHAAQSTHLIHHILSSLLVSSSRVVFAAASVEREKRKQERGKSSQSGTELALSAIDAQTAIPEVITFPPMSELDIGPDLHNDSGFSIYLFSLFDLDLRTFRNLFICLWATDPTSFVAIRPQEGSKKNGLSSRDFDGLTAQIKNLEKTANVS
ncbi:hypothetical protein R3P38DRAFT_3422523 [Favolaschia claudopus]|uniref:Uncharacterized protein n=1 Tax=Favolaschia claudopus TaxID=2862362 RepID=A0AAW0D6A5_9AGAR